jgi:hypothetical protein
MFKLLDRACALRDCDGPAPFEGGDCTKRGEGVGFAEPLVCCDLFGVADGRAGVEDREFLDE